MERLNRTYFGVVRECPTLLPLAFTAGATQLAFALLNICAYPLYLKQVWGLSGLQIGVAMAAFLICEALLKAPMGHASDRYGRKPFIVLGPLLVSLNPLLTTLLPARLWMLVLPIRAADGAGAAALWPPLYALVGDISRRSRRAAAMSIVNTVYMGAFAAAIALGAIVASPTSDYRVLFYLAAGLLFVSGLIGQFTLPSVCQVVEEEEEAPPSEDAAPSPVAGMPYSFPLILLLSFLMYFGALLPAGFMLLFVQNDLHLVPVRLWPLGLALGVPLVVLGAPLGHMADRLGRAFSVRLFLTVAAAAMWLLALVLVAVSQTLAGAHAASSVVVTRVFGPHFVAWLVASHHYLLLVGGTGIFLALGLVFGIPAWMALVSTLAPSSRRGAVMGAVATAEGIGAAVGPIVGGVLWDVGHSFIFYGSAGSLTLAAMTALYALRRGRGPGTARGA